MTIVPVNSLVAEAPAKLLETCKLTKVFENKRAPKNERPLSWLTGKEFLVIVDHMERNPNSCLVYVVRNRETNHMHFQFDTIRRIK